MKKNLKVILLTSLITVVAIGGVTCIVMWATSPKESPAMEDYSAIRARILKAQTQEKFSFAGLLGDIPDHLTTVAELEDLFRRRVLGRDVLMICGTMVANPIGLYAEIHSEGHVSGHKLTVVIEAHFMENSEIWRFAKDEPITVSGMIEGISIQESERGLRGRVKMVNCVAFGGLLSN